MPLSRDDSFKGQSRFVLYQLHRVSRAEKTESRQGNEYQDDNEYHLDNLRGWRGKGKEGYQPVD
jgi:hypothetical protein